jgi:predicted permease
MAKKDFNYNITSTFYAKWILPFVLIIVGAILLVVFFPGMKFQKGKDYDTKEEKVFYVTKIEGEISYIGVKDKCIYIEKSKGSYDYMYNTETIYDGSVPWYSPVRMNLAIYGTTGGIGLSVVGFFMLLINTFNKISKVSAKKEKKILENNKKDEEDDE